MKKLFILLYILVSSALNSQTAIPNIQIQTLISDTLLNVRALEISNQNVYIATSNSEVMILKNGETQFVNLVDVDTVNKPNFRALAIVIEDVFTLGVGSPALLYKNGQIVYQENHEKAFYDSMEFWNESEGIAMGDPTEDCISIIITRDGGDTWTKVPCENLPKAKEGEAAFAASDTNIAIKGNKTWIATGGMASRVLFSADKGVTWTVKETPVIQGQPTTGMYSIDFYNDKIGYAIGGDYTDSDKNIANKVHTIDGGQTWNLIANGAAPSYRSCVQYIPNSEGKKLVSIGFKGIDYSADSGYSWTHLSDESFYTVRFLNEKIAYAAGKGRVSKITFE